MKRKVNDAVLATQTKVQEYEELVKQQDAARQAAFDEVARIEAEQKRIAEEEIVMLDELSSNITAMCKEKGVWCGILLTKEDVLKIVEYAMTHEGNIPLPFKIYFDDKEDDTTDATNEASVIEPEPDVASGI